MEITKEYVEELIRQYNLIQQKKCTLSRKGRDSVEELVKRFVEEGIINNVETDGSK